MTLDGSRADDYFMEIEGLRFGARKNLIYRHRTITVDYVNEQGSEGFVIRTEKK
jgi:hypothetical protein